MEERNNRRRDKEKGGKMEQICQRGDRKGRTVEARKKDLVPTALLPSLTPRVEASRPSRLEGTYTLTLHPPVLSQGIPRLQKGETWKQLAKFSSFLFLQELPVSRGHSFPCSPSGVPSPQTPAGPSSPLLVHPPPPPSSPEGLASP